MLRLWPQYRHTSKYKNCYKADSNQPCRTGTEKGWNAVTAEVNALPTTLRRVEDLKKTGNELVFVFSVDKYLNKSEFKMG